MMQIRINHILAVILIMIIILFYPIQKGKNPTIAIDKAEIHVAIKNLELTDPSPQEWAGFRITFNILYWNPLEKDGERSYTSFA